MAGDVAMKGSSRFLIYTVAAPSHRVYAESAGTATKEAHRLVKAHHVAAKVYDYWRQRVVYTATVKETS